MHATLAVLFAASWVAAGALFKLLAGSPNDLPPAVQDFFLGPVQTFRAAIAIELCIVILALLRPRHAWLPLCALFSVFLAVLFPLVRAGVESCGCFGSSVTITPQAMMAIDGGLLREDGRILYPVREGIPILLIEEGLPVGS